MMLFMAFILMCTAILIISVNVSKLDKRIEKIEELEYFYGLHGECLENEVDD